MRALYDSVIIVTEVVRITNEEIISRGGEDVAYQLWLNNQGIIRSTAIRWSKATGTDFEDLMQSGYLAVDDALKSYTPERGKFTTLLDFYLKKHFTECCASYSGLTRSQWWRVGDNEIRTVSLYKKVGEEEDTELIDLIEDKDYTDLEDLIDRLEQEDLRKLLNEVVNKLKPTEREVIRLYYYNCMDTPEIAERLNVTPSRVGQIRHNALLSLRRLGRNTRLEYYFNLHRVNAVRDCYYYVGLDRFNTSGISAVEQIVFDREALRERWKDTTDEIRPPDQEHNS